MVVKQKFIDPQTLTNWHDRLGHPGSIMIRRIIESSHGHSLRGQEIPQKNKSSCIACSIGKLITRPSLVKSERESPIFLEHIQCDICGPPCGKF